MRFGCAAVCMHDDYLPPGCSTRFNTVFEMLGVVRRTLRLRSYARGAASFELNIDLRVMVRGKGASKGPWAKIPNRPVKVSPAFHQK